MSKANVGESVGKSQIKLTERKDGRLTADGDPAHIGKPVNPYLDGTRKGRIKGGQVYRTTFSGFGESKVFANEEVPNGLTVRSQEILVYLDASDCASIMQIMDYVGLTLKKANEELDILVKLDAIVRIGDDYSIMAEGRRIVSLLPL